MTTKKLIAAVLGLCLAAGNFAMLPADIDTRAANGVSHDVNADGSFDIVDIIVLTKYLHLNGTLADYEAADIDNSGDVDIFDLAFMMRALVGLDEEEPVIHDPQTIQAKCLSADYTAGTVEALGMSEEIQLGQTAFALQLIQQTAEEGKNVLVSPYSVSQALGMTANGANGTTRTEMENVLGGGMGALNPGLRSMRVNAPDNDSSRLLTANSIWVKDGFPVNPAFLQTNADYYDADAYAAPFNDQTVKDVNNWVDMHTDHMIPGILEALPEDAVMLLVNAVTFDAKWADAYTKDNIGEMPFTKSDGETQMVDMMYCYDSRLAIVDEHAIGFKQYYQYGGDGDSYYFAALLPEEGMTPEAYLAQLTPEGLRKALTQQEKIVTCHALPAFSYDYDISLKDPLKAMGMPTAFERNDADFSNMYTPDGGVEELYIDDVLHKTHIEVNSAGTRAGAATAVVMTEECAIEPSDGYTVILDRPFVYMIVDAATDIPVFIGTVNEIESPES